MSSFDKVLGSWSLFVSGGFAKTAFFGGALLWWEVGIAIVTGVFALLFLVRLFTKKVV